MMINLPTRISKNPLAAIVFLLCLFPLFTSCSTTDTPPPSVTPAPSETPIPTDTSIPTHTATFTPTETDVPSQVITADNVNQVEELAQISFKSKIPELIFHQDGTWLADRVEESIISITDIDTSEQLARLEHGNAPIDMIIVSKDGNLLAAVSSSQDKVYLWQLDNFELVAELDFPDSYISYTAFSARRAYGDFSSKNQYLVISACISWECPSSAFVVYDLKTQEINQRQVGYQRYAGNVFFTPDDKWIVLVGQGENVLRADLLVWDFQKQEIVKTLQAYYPRFYWGEINPAGNEVAVIQEQAFEDSLALGFIDLETWKYRKVRDEGLNISPGIVRYSLAAPILVTEETGDSIAIRDANSGVILRLFKPTGGIGNILISPDGKRIYIMSEPKQFLVWGIPD
ncbi:MAG: PD40 domain-containing protein [Anaerolineales bacterium]|nr:PD40 domain-containing protein [Anaerolineales bacterium]